MLRIKVLERFFQVGDQFVHHHIHANVGDDALNV